MSTPVWHALGPDRSCAGSGEPTSPQGSSAQNRTPSPSTRAPKKARYLIRWGFKPKLLGYVPNVRGAVTGVP